MTTASSAPHASTQVPSISLTQQSKPVANIHQYFILSGIDQKK
jgi:hypothetical protein